MVKFIYFSINKDDSQFSACLNKYKKRYGDNINNSSNDHVAAAALDNLKHLKYILSVTQYL